MVPFMSAAMMPSYELSIREVMNSLERRISRSIRMRSVRSRTNMAIFFLLSGVPAVLTQTSKGCGSPEETTISISMQNRRLSRAGLPSHSSKRKPRPFGSSSEEKSVPMRVS